MGVSVEEPLFLPVVIDRGVKAVAQEVDVPLDGLLGNLPVGGEVKAVWILALADPFIQLEKAGELGLVSFHDAHPFYWNIGGRSKSVRHKLFLTDTICTPPFCRLSKDKEEDQRKRDI